MRKRKSQRVRRVHLDGKEWVYRIHEPYVTISPPDGDRRFLNSNGNTKKFRVSFGDIDEDTKLYLEEDDRIAAEYAARGEEYWNETLIDLGPQWQIRPSDVKRYIERNILGTSNGG